MKILRGTVTGGVVFFLLGWLVYGVLLMNYMTANMKGDAPSPIAVTLYTKDGREVSVIITSSIIKNSEGKPSAAIVVFKDITLVLSLSR
jgi:PAS domain-containing protein